MDFSHKGMCKGIHLFVALEAENMKILILIAIISGLVFSTSAFAGKARITSTWDNTGDLSVEVVDAKSCKYACSSTFFVTYQVHRNTSLGLQLLVGDQVSSLKTWLLQNNESGWRYWDAGCFVIPAGETFSLVWVLESTRRNRRIIDAEEVYTGVCNP